MCVHNTNLEKDEKCCWCYRQEAVSRATGGTEDKREVFSR